jgi:alkylated DNA nucleotide flippase Atl1
MRSVHSNRERRPEQELVPALEVDSRAGDRFPAAVFCMRPRIVATIRKIPRGKVSTYGAIARAAGYPGAARQVVHALHSSVGLPWHRVLGSGGEIKLRGDSAIEQRLRLEAEGVAFRGRKVDMGRHEFRFARAAARKKALVRKLRKKLTRDG